MKFLCSAVLVVCLASCATLDQRDSVGETGFSLTADGRASCLVVISDDATSTERHAAKELQRYVRQISGARLPIRTASNVSRGGDGRAYVVLGRPDTNQLLRTVCSASDISLTAEVLGPDGFVIKTAERDGSKYLLLGGSSDISALYAVYDLLERYCDVGFFWDVEHVPTEKTIAIPDASVISKPRFARRVNMQGCAYGYSATFWLLDDWKYELDWMAKNKFNTLYYPVVENRGECLVQTNVMKKFGAQAPPPREWDRWIARLSSDLISYAQRIGIEVSVPGWPGVVTEAFKQANPDVDYIRVQWLDMPPDWQIRPTDPMFRKVGAEYLREFKRLYGDAGHLYTFDPYAEAGFAGTADEARAIRAAYAREVSAMIREVDAAGEWYMSSWALQGWSMEDYRSFVEAIPKNMLLINDTWAEGNPQFTRFDSFLGQRWGFGVLHSMGGWTIVHGDIPDLIRRMKEAAKLTNCVMYTNSPEIIRHNIPYFDAVTHVGWDPEQATTDQWKRDYARRRYGKAYVAGMTPFLDELLAGVYSSNERAFPWYQSPQFEVPEGVNTRPAIIAHLRKALETGLELEAELADNECYERDMYEVARQYLADLSAVYLADTVKAVHEKDSAAFEAGAARVRKCLGSLEYLLGSRREYYIQEEINRAKKTGHRGGASKDPDVTNAQDIRTRYTALIDEEHVGIDHGLNDYAHRDMYELLRFYYRPRAEAYLAYLKSELDGRDDADKPDVKRQYTDLRNQFIKTDHNISVPPSGCVGLQAVRQALAEE